MKKIVFAVLIAAGTLTSQASACQFSFLCANCTDDGYVAVRSVLPDVVTAEYCQLFPGNDYKLMLMVNKYGDHTGKRIAGAPTAVAHAIVWVAKENSLMVGDYTFGGYAVDANDSSYANSQFMLKEATRLAVSGLMKNLGRIERKDIR